MIVDLLNHYKKSGLESIKVHKSHLLLRRTLVRFLGLEDPLGEDHEKVDAAHHEHAAPEPHHTDDDGLKIMGY